MILASTIDPHGMSVSDELKHDIHYIISSEKPEHILETGTYLGLGSTKTVLDSLLYNGLTDSVFVTIEANKVFAANAKNNLKDYNQFIGFEIANMVSIPQYLLPKEIDSDFPDSVITDHHDASRYKHEINSDVPFDGIGYALNKMQNMPDLVILDSAGHLGTIEFHYLMGIVDSSFTLILDDTLHRKHYKTMQYIRSDERFSILKESTSKFGYAIVKYSNP